MTTIFDSFKPAAKDKVAISAFLDACQKQYQTPTNLTITVAVYGPQGSGKTTLALALAQCPPLQTSASSKTGAISVMVLPTKAKPVKLQIFDILDSGANFILTDCFAVIIDGLQPNFSYVDKIAAQAFEHQRAVIVVSKTDLLDARQLKIALQAAGQVKRLLSQKLTQVHVIAAKLTENGCQQPISSLLFEYYLHCKAMQLERELRESQRSLNDAYRTNKAGFSSKIVASVEKRETRLEKYLVEQVFDLYDPKIAECVKSITEQPEELAKNTISLMDPPKFDANSMTQTIEAENETTAPLHALEVEDQLQAMQIADDARQADNCLEALPEDKPDYADQVPADMPGKAAEEVPEEQAQRSFSNEKNYVESAEENTADQPQEAQRSEAQKRSNRKRK